MSLLIQGREGLEVSQYWLPQLVVVVAEVEAGETLHEQQGPGLAERTASFMLSSDLREEQHCFGEGHWNAKYR